ncbi:MAG: sugar porter family MFS transporter [Xanthobacter sp.]
MIYIVAAVAGIAGFLFGFDEGIIAGALHLLRAQFQISPVSEGLMTSAVPLGALFGAIMAGPAVEHYGRRSMLLFAALLFAAGALLSSATLAIWMLSLARLILGFAVGIAALVAPLYISESAPPKKRGMLVSIYQLAITLGILGAYLASYGFSDSWRTMFLLGVVPGAALFASMWLMPETPRWLAAQGRTGQAQAVLSRLRGISPQSPALQGEMTEIARTAASDGKGGSWADLLGPVARPALVVGIGLFFLQQLSGINAVIYYAPEIFREAGFDSGSSRLLASVGIGLVNVLMTLVGMALIDRIGRRALLLIGFIGTAFSLGMIAIGAATEAQSLDIVALAGLVIYIGAFAASLGPLPWVMMSEIFPQNVRGIGMSAATVANWGFNFLVVFSFPLLIAYIGLGGIFTIYAMACLVGIIFTLRAVPETSGIPLEEIEDHLKSGRPFCELGSPA